MKTATRYQFVLMVIVLIIFWNIVSLGAADYVIRAEDKLRLKIFQFPELSGEYTVSATGTISIPPIGDISVSGLSATELSRDISNRFKKAAISDKPGATVEVLQSRPIYVLGDVQKPGEYTYRHGITVLQAISLAGGWFRRNDLGFLRLDKEIIVIKGDTRDLIRRYFHLLAERARLNSELALRSEVSFPPELTQKAKDDAALTQLLGEERAFLRINVEAFKSQLSSLDKTRGLYEKGIEAVSNQISANNIEMRSVETQLNTIKGLLARGLSPMSPKWNLERMQAQVEVAAQGYQSIILRAQQNINEVEQKIFDLKSERQTKLNKELQKTRLDLDEVSVKLDTNQQLMQEAQSSASTLVSNLSDIVVAHSFSIIRTDDGRGTTIDAEENTELLPGDVLKVEKSAIASDIADRAGPNTRRFIPAHVRN
jgi:exopolysaccharide production protein ExoF